MKLLPISLFAIVQCFLARVDAQQQLSLDTVLDLTANALPNPPMFTLPTSSDSPLNIFVALCASADPSPRFFVTNDSSISDPGPANVDDKRIFEIRLGPDGVGQWSSPVRDGGMLAIVRGTSSTPFQIFASTSDTSATPESPLFGDSTGNQALLLSPPFSPPPAETRSFPNYTFPPANIVFPDPPTSPPNFTLIIERTASSRLASLPRTACALRQAQVEDVTVLETGNSEGLWLRDERGWRWQWVAPGLAPETNHTVLALQPGKLASSRPTYFVTKSPTFPCALAHSLPYCPAVSWSIPLALPSRAIAAHTASTIPARTASTLAAVLTNFTTTLSTLACGRDVYSPLVTCADCQAAYRAWLCAVAFPRCAEAPPSSSPPSSPSPALRRVEPGAAPRNALLPPFPQAHDVLLPCLETCNVADRACPVFLGFKCPLPRFTAAASYGVGFVDSGEEGVIGEGSVGVAEDAFGNVWCNKG